MESCPCFRALFCRSNEQMEQYNLYKVVPLLVDFIDNLTNWYIRRSRRRLEERRMIGQNDAYSTLYWVLWNSQSNGAFLPFLRRDL